MMSGPTRPPRCPRSAGGGGVRGGGGAGEGGVQFVAGLTPPPARSLRPGRPNESSSSPRSLSSLPGQKDRRGRQ